MTRYLNEYHARRDEVPFTVPELLSRRETAAIFTLDELLRQFGLGYLKRSVAGGDHGIATVASADAVEVVLVIVGEPSSVRADTARDIAHDLGFRRLREGEGILEGRAGAL